MKVAITGATGFVGSRLVERLSQAGHSVVVFTRNLGHANRVFPSSSFPTVTNIAYTPTQAGEWQQAIAGCDGVVNLAGEPIAESRWTPDRKRMIVESRQLTTRLLVEAIAQADPKPSVLVSGSAIGYYGTSETASFDETSGAGDDFLAQVCQAWEAEAMRVKESGTRLVILRTGIVLGLEGGAIAKMITPFRLFAGGPLGTGKQWVSWIHRDDLVELIIQSLNQPSYEGVLNATAPNPVRMAEFCHVMGEALNRPSWLPVPEIALEALLGDAAKMVLEGQQVLPQRTQAAGFHYQFADIQSALRDVLS
ncbi:MAG: TIGR01777 family protein [Synechococcales cyanobacterium K44_A2020_017]|nr:TIGR01777 family protein [Synechococcales cyanobacterium K32_A2020_035]MBF2095145.1 TIGR01777 family protein [Synechococcales cyanobacterium K44_A2020_017]